MDTAPLIGISRLRMGTDGHGVTTLVAFHGCPLHCVYCLNKHCKIPEGIWKTMTAQEIYDEVKKDALYFKATNGGVTFGGGEPMLHADIITEILELGAKKWHTSIETSLNVPQEKLKLLLPYINHYIVDIKDMDPMLYLSYTGADNTKVIQNLLYLAKQGKADHVTVRVPLIPHYNHDTFGGDRDKSIAQLKSMGFTHFDKFNYRTKKNLVSNWLDRKKSELINPLPGAVTED